MHGTIPKPTRTITSTKITSSMPMLRSAQKKNYMNKKTNKTTPKSIQHITQHLLLHQQ
jgi:hypothetical protein